MIPLHCNLCGFVPGRAGGAQVFLEGLLPQFSHFEEIDLRIYGSTACKRWLNSFLDGRFEFRETGSDSPGVMNRFFATRELRSIPLAGEIVWSPLNQGVGGSCKAKEIITIHDLIPLHYSEPRKEYDSNLKRRLAFTARWKNSMRVAKKAAAIVTVSDSNVDELQRAIGGKKPKVFGAPNGIDVTRQKAAAEKPWQYSGTPTVLAVTSGSKPHKGIRTLEKVASILSDVEFRIVGKGTSANESNIVHTGKLSVEELNDEYRNTSALFFPSRIEGFGLPVLEAAVFGTPVVATDIPVLREVGGSDSLYFEMDNADEAAEHLKTAIDSREKAESMSHAGKLHAAQFTWENAAEIYRHIFQNILN
jgi:glycosyltransferase involved in cell wall biosynthesis